LLIKKATCLQTKLRYVNIHSYRLRQKVQRGAFYIRWQETQQIIADSLIKALGRQPFYRFIKLLSIKNI
jgi:hypothetical protein